LLLLLYPASLPLPDDEGVKIAINKGKDIKRAEIVVFETVSQINELLERATLDCD
jgi:hypothetical protein